MQFSDYSQPLTDLTPGLYIVATPIGNLRDITLRALDTLKTVDLILAEDTRQTQKLLSHYDIGTHLVSYHDHNVAKRLPTVIQALRDGQRIAQVSDAGTPLISDPGYKLVRAAIDDGHAVTPIPGASALLAGLTVAGLPTDKFSFFGFPPARSGARQRALRAMTHIPGTLVFFETPSRITACLEDCLTCLGDRPAVLARELTKRYEETRRGLVSELLDSVAIDPPRGEIVLMLGPPAGQSGWTEGEIDTALDQYIPEMGVKRASSHIAELSGWSRRDVYQRALQRK